jgi:hypothetical protein
MTIIRALEFLAGCFLMGVGLLVLAVAVCGALFIVEEFRKARKSLWTDRTGKALSIDPDHLSEPIARAKYVEVGE